jgi:predicted MFS family arabinose efflux permease
MEPLVLPIALLAAAGFLSSAGARVIDPLLAPMAQDLHVSIPAVSIVIAAFTIPYGLNQLLLGPMGDRYGKLRVILGALIAYAVATAGCAFARNLLTLTLLRALAGASSAGLIPVCLAYIGDCVPYSLRQVVLGRFLTGVTLALMAAGPIGGAFGQYISWRGVFLLLSAGALLLATLIGLRLRQVPDSRHDGALLDFRPYGTLARHPLARRLLLATMVEGALMAGSFPFLAPYLHVRFGLAFGPIGLVLACFGVGAFLYTRYAKALVHRLGEPGLVVIGGFGMAAALACSMALPNWIGFLAVELVLGLGYLMLHGVLQTRATEMLPVARGTAVASFALMLFVGQALGALAIGLAISRLGYSWAFRLDAVLILALTLFLFGLLRRSEVH